MKKSTEKICAITLSSFMVLGIGSSVIAAPLSKLPSISDNSLVIGKHLFELDKVNSSQYNLNKFVEASKTVDEDNKVYYKYNGKWYTGNDIESFTNLKNAKGLDTITNDIIKINGQDINHEDPVKPGNVVNEKPKVEPKEQNKQDKNKIYNDGQYEGEAQGFKSLIKVKVTIKNDKIIKVDILHQDDTPGIFNQAKEIVQNIIKKQTYKVDVITNATCSSNGIKGAVKNALEKAKIPLDSNKEDKEQTKPEEVKKKIYNDGEYEGKGQGFNSYIKVRVTIKNHNINAIDVIEENDSKNFFNRAKNIISKIIDKQTVEVDAISNATFSSNGIKVAVKDALTKAENNLNENNQKEDINSSEVKDKKILFSLDNFTQEGKPNKVEFTKIPNRVITTNQSTTELLLSLGLEDHMVGTACADNDILPSLIDKYKKVPILAPMYPKAEVAEKQNPDFIIGWNSAFRGYGVGFTENWNKKGVPTFIQRNTVKSQSIDNAYKDIEEVGKIFDVKDRTDKLIQDLKNQIKQVENKVKDVKKPLKVIAVEMEGPNDFCAYGSKHLVNDMIKKAGGINIGDGKWWYASDIDYKNPDSILVITYNSQDKAKSSMEALKKVDALKNTNAIKNNKIMEVGLADIYPGGVRMADVIEKMAKTFYPEKFNENNSNFKLDWYQDGDYGHDKDGKDESIEQFVVTFNKPIDPKKGTLKVIIPDNTKKDPYGNDKLGEIEVKMDGTSKEKPLKNIKGGDKVTFFIRPDDSIQSNNRFILELTQDWTSILNTEKTGIHYYDDTIKGLKLVAEGLKDLDGNLIEDIKGSNRITANRYIDLCKDEEKPYIVAQKLIYDKIGINGFQKAGSLGIVFNEPIQLYTKEMAEDGVIPPVIYRDHNPLTPSPEQIGKYENFLPELDVTFEKVDDLETHTEIKGKYDLMADILDSNKDINSLTQIMSINMGEISHKFDLDPQTKGVNRFRDYGMFYITPDKSLSEGKWRVKIKGVSDDAGNEMDEYLSEVFDIKPLFNIESMNKDSIKIKFTEPFKKDSLTKDGITLVVTKYGEVVASALLSNLKEGQIEAEGKFIKPIEDELEGEYFINNISYTIK